MDRKEKLDRPDKRGGRVQWDNLDHKVSWARRVRKDRPENKVFLEWPVLMVLQVIQAERDHPVTKVTPDHPAILVRLDTLDREELKVMLDHLARRDPTATRVQQDILDKREMPD